jgi:UDP-N-acetylglucosamine 2-epimerase (non-hydrolysing)
VLVAREVTERPEGVEQGWARLVGTDPTVIRLALEEELHRSTTATFRSPSGDTPYGDGQASRRIADIVVHELTGSARRTSDWRPSDCVPVQQ